MSPNQIIVILLRRFWIFALVFTGVMIGAGGLMLLVPPRYDAQASSTIDPAQTDPVTGQAVGATSVRILQGNLVALAKSQRVAGEVVRRLNLANSPALVAQYRASGAVGRVDVVEWVASEILRSLDARFNEGTNVMLVIFKWSDAVQAAQIANTFLAAFIDAAIELKVIGAQQTAQWFEPQTEKLRVEVEEARAKISAYQKDEKLAPTTQGDSDVSLLQSITAELSSVKGENLKIESVLQLLEKADPAKAEFEVRQFDSPLLVSLRNNLASTIVELSKLEAEFGSRNPKVNVLLATQKSLRAQIVSEFENSRIALTTRLKAVQTQIAFLEKARAEQLEHLIGVQGQRNQLAALARDFEVKQERHTAAMRTGATARLQGQLSFSNIAVLDRAVPPVSPSFPRFNIVMMAALGAGLALGVILSLIGEAIDRRIRFPADLEFATSVQNLGSLVAVPVSRRSLRTHRLAIGASKA